ncbi:MAG: hypothetical protein ACRDQZ_10665 [Mycobacteriales bacterium]
MIARLRAWNQTVPARILGVVGAIVVFAELYRTGHGLLAGYLGGACGALDYWLRRRRRQQRSIQPHVVDAGSRPATTERP